MSLSALSMSQTKEDLLQHLDISPEIYALLASETDHVYMWLINSAVHFKSNSRRCPPYDWSDITEQGKWDAMKRLSESKNPYTMAYWSLGHSPASEDSPNWIAKWFLYHKFRYRDGRNRVRDLDESAKGEPHHKPNRSSRAAGPGAVAEASFQCSGHEAESGSVNSMSYESPPSTTEKSDFVKETDSDGPGQLTRLCREYTDVNDLFFDPVKNAWVPK